MAVPNAAPIYSRVGDIQWSGTLLTANVAMDGTGTVVTAFTADATNGGRLEKIRVKHLGTNVVTVLRLFINNGLTNATAANNSLFGELTIAANTLTQVASGLDIDYVFPLMLPPGYKITATLGTTIAAGIVLNGVGGKY